jgi:hypothetical protein
MTTRARRDPRLAAMSEKSLQDTIVKAARALNYLVFHAATMQRSEPGFPDLVIVGNGTCWFLELKTARGKLRPPTVTARGRCLPGQQEWIDAINACANVEAAVVRPDDLDNVLDVLRTDYERWIA